MNHSNKNEKTEEMQIIVNSIECLLFSLKKFSLNMNNQKKVSFFYFLNIMHSWITNKKNSNKNFVLVFLQTSEKVYNFIKILIGITSRFRILDFSKKFKFLLSRNLIYLTLKNNINLIQICQLLKKNKKFFTSSFFSINNQLNENYLFVENGNGKFDFKFVNIFEDNRKYFFLLNQFAKFNLLDFHFTIKNVELYLFLNSFNLKLKRSINSYIKVINFMKKKNYIKTLFILDGLKNLHNFQFKSITHDFSSITRNSSFRSNLSAIKKFNSNKVRGLIISNKIWKKNNLFNRIDPRTLTVIFKIKFLSKKDNLYGIKSFFYF
jgi:hypothetical protein